MKPLRLDILFLLSLLTTILLQAQGDFDASNAGIPLRFEAINADKGLPQKRISGLFQDHLGFIWLGTPNGLVKYDGYEFQTYQYHQSDSINAALGRRLLLANRITEDANGDLWLNGVHRSQKQQLIFKFERATEKLTPFSFDGEAGALVPYDFGREKRPSIIRSYIRHLHYAHGFLWIASDRLFRIPLSEIDVNRDKPGPLHYQVFDAEKSTPYEEGFWYFFEDEKNRLWITGVDGIYQWMQSRDTLIFHHLPDPLLRGPTPGLIYIQMAESRDGKLWFFPDPGGFLVRLNPLDGTSEILKNPSFQFNFFMLQANPGQVWFGKRDGRGGLRIFDLNTLEFTPVKMEVDGLLQLPIAQVSSLLKDRSGTLWVANRYGSLLRHEPQRSNFHWLHFEPDNADALSHNWVHGLTQDQSGIYWITTYGGGLNRWDRANGSFEVFRTGEGPEYGPTSEYLMGIEVSNDGKVWFGSGRSISYYDPIREHFRHHNGPSVAMDIQLDSKDRIWATKAPSGLFLFDPQKDQFNPIQFPSRTDSTRMFNPFRWGAEIFLDSKENLWIGTIMRPGAGFYRFNVETKDYQFYDLPEGRTFLEDQRKNIWVGTGDGLYRFNAQYEPEVCYRIEDGLANNAVQGMLEDDRGRLWISTDHGLSCFDPDTASFRNYFRGDGLPANEFEHAAYKNDLGELFFSGGFGLLYFHPDSIRDNPIAPQLAFTSLDLQGKRVAPGMPGSPLEKHISVTKKVELAHWQNDLTIHYAALHYKNPENNLYQIKLDNYHKDWQPASHLNFSNFTNLEPGRYTLRVKAANSDGIWNRAKDHLALRIVIRPPWYWCWWSQALYLVLFISGLLSLYYFQLNRRLAISETNRLRELGEVKSRLYTNITHEFRTPLTVISGMVDQMSKDPQKWFREGAAMIKHHSSQLLNLVSQLLDLSRLESNSITLHFQQDDIISFCKYLVQSFHSLADTQAITIHFYSRKSSLVMDFDPDALTKIMGNLLSNAIKFTDNGGHIYISLAEEGTFLSIVVRDTGIGIPEAELSHVFDRFYQIDDGSTRVGEGTGIGLALTKELVNLMGGHIKAESKLGEGTTFTVWLPVAHRTERTSTSLRPSFQHSPIALAREAVAVQQPTDHAGDLPLALIIEDNQDVVRYLSACLDGGYRLEISKDGEEGIEKAIELVPDIVISDIMMPKKDGYEVTRTLKNDERTDHIPIILLTAKADQESKIKGLDYGADAYLYKPFQPEELEVRLRKLIELRTKLQRRYGTGFIPDPTGNALYERQDAFMIRLKEEVEARMGEPDFGIPVVLKAMAISRTQLHNKLKALTGKSTSHVLRSIRLQKARELLQASDRNVSEVARAVGFNSLAYFSTCFSEEFGQSPSQVKRAAEQ